MTPEENKFKVFQQIAHLKVAGVSQEQIAETLGVTAGRISQLCTSEEYLQVETLIRNESLEQNKAFNDGWDGLEAGAIDNLQATLKFNKDPEINLRIAAIANKARRRGGNGVNAPAIPGNNGMRATIGLPSHFVINVQQNGGVLQVQQKTTAAADALGAHVQSTPVQKYDTMAPGRVEQLFSGMAREKEKVEREKDLLGNVLEGIDVAAAMKS